MPDRRRFLAGAAACAASLTVPAVTARAAERTFRYGHMNSPTSIAGMQADWLAEAIAANTGGAVEVQVYPSSQLGKLQELAEAVSTGAIALSHNTAGAFGSLYPPFAALDTPYLYRDVDHLLRVTDVDSPVMQQLSRGLVERAGVRVLYAYYFGTRHLTADREVKRPADLAGVKIRAIPFPIYMATVEGLGAIPVPVDWSEVPTALATGVVSGQENPVNVILDARLYEVQSHLMLTGHIMAAQVVVMNDAVWQDLDDAQREAITAAARDVRARATRAVLDKEAADLAELARLGMTVVGPEQGLDLDAFRESVRRVVQERFASEYGGLYDAIAAL